MKQLFAVSVLAAFLANSASAQSGFWRDKEGKPIAESDAMKSKNDFAGSLLVTTDENWKEKWDNPPDTKPNFNKAGAVPYGRKVFLLTFFANPKLDATGNANVRCDFKIISPTGTVSLAQNNLNCFSGRIAGNPYNMYLSGPVIAFSGDPGDPPGTWAMEVKLRDESRGVELPLRTSFELKAAQ